MNDQEPDYHNFSTSPSHRLPVLNGTQAFLDAIEKHKPISTGIPQLDRAIRGPNDPLDSAGGVPRGSVTEVYGPPGSGKTTLAMHLVVNMLRDSDSREKVVWIDTTTAVNLPRLARIARGHVREPRHRTVPLPHENREATARSPSQIYSRAADTVHEPDFITEENFMLRQITQLPHFVLFALEPPDEILPDKTTLLVIDGLSSLVMAGLPDRAHPTDAPPPSPAREEIFSKNLAARRAIVVGNISAALHNLAASRNMAVVVLSQVSANRRSGSKATLRSVLSSKQWDASIGTRIVLYRRFWPSMKLRDMPRKEARRWITRMKQGLRVAEVERVNGRAVATVGVKFVILRGGMRAVDGLEEDTVAPLLPVLPPGSASSQSGAEEEEDEGGLQEPGVGDEDEDASLQMPEDEMPSNVEILGNGRSVPSKRKMVEIADSDDDQDENENGNAVSPVEVEAEAEARLPLMPTRHGTFLPSSQLRQDDADETHSDGKE